MREPLRRGVPIDMARMRRWLDLFTGYRVSITESRIDRWLRQFSRQHRDVAARLLDCVDYFTPEQMTSVFRSLLRGLNGWSEDERTRRGRWRFSPFSTSAGESGDTMLYTFRLASGLATRKYNELFPYKSELLGQHLGSDDTVVFVDDFAGTGEQACTTWRETIQELLPERPRIFLVLVASSTEARKRIDSETEMSVAPGFELTDADNIFSPKCVHFNVQEKKIIHGYCQRADRTHPKGFGDCGFVVVFAHRCPNDSISILHAHDPSGRRWEGLFRRHDS